MIYDILKNALLKYENNVAVSYQNHNISYGELNRSVIQLAETLNHKGMKKGDNVLLAMDNCIEFIESFFAINLAGGIIIPVYMNMGEKKLQNIIEFYDIKHILSIKKYNTIFSNVIKNELKPLNNIFYVTHNEGKLEVEFLNISSELEGDKNIYINSNQVGIILFSSGTTNVPKGIMLSNSNIESNVVAISNYLKITQDDKILLIKNINHASSITGEMLVSIYNGCTLYLMNGILTAAHIMDTITKERITVLFGVPTILSAMMTHKNFDSYDLNSLSIINFYGAKMAISKIKELAEKFPKSNLIYSYGLTEAAPRVTYIMRDNLFLKEGSSGIPINDVDISIFIDDEETESNIIGEICVKGPNVMLGYYKNEKSTQRVLRNGRLHTGDLGYKDKDGYLYVTGRKDNLIIKTGKNIYPEEIESVIMGFEGVQDVLVRGEEDDLLGEDIVAYIVMANKKELKLLDVFRHCKKELEDYKIPGKVYKVNELEKTLSGKIIRKQILDIK